jgi:nucleoside-diphosphate-sugar epimerase
VLGVSGMSGRAIAAELARAGWDVVGTGRDAARFPAALGVQGVRFLRSDRHDLRELGAAVTGGDVIVDCLCFTAEHARELLRHRAAFGSAVVLSSKAVYVDGGGRHSNSDAMPRFDRPVSEHEAVLEPDFSGAYASREGYGPNKVAAEITLLQSGVAVSIIRPSRIHGPGSAEPREAFVVERLLVGVTRFPLAHAGQTGNHPTAAVNLARLVATCAHTPGTRVLNSGDPGRPTARDIVLAIAAACGRPVEIDPLEDDAPDQLGWTPWANWPPFFLDVAASLALGYEPAGGYAETVGPTVRELIAAATPT